MDSVIVAEDDLEKQATATDNDHPILLEDLALSDHEKPINMPLWKKWTITMLTGVMTAIITQVNPILYLEMSVLSRIATQIAAQARQQRLYVVVKRCLQPDVVNGSNRCACWQ